MDAFTNVVAFSQRKATSDRRACARRPQGIQSINIE